MSLKIPSTSKEYVKAQVTTDVDTSAATVSFAFLAPGVEPTSEWVVGSWYTTPAVLPDGDYQGIAQILVGPSSSWVLANGTYMAWIKVTTGQEDIHRVFDRLTVS